MRPTLCLASLAAALSLALPSVLAAADPDADLTRLPDINWHTSYGEAWDLAKQQGKMLLIFFHNPDNPGQSDRFQTESLDQPDVRRRLQDYVCARLPLDTRIVVQGKLLTLLEHEAFEEMLGRPGVAIIDLTDPDGPLYRDVVSTFPLTADLWYGPQQMQVILDLPRGTLTQRTLIYAVRIHPDGPASTNGQLDPNLLEEAESHSQHQARIRRQGHHQWSTRFHRINALLPAGLSACEVCAESWPGEKLVEAAIECVRCWRLSSGHWSAVNAPQDRYGYDMKRGSNGVWYATGIFGS
jgi:hypothetical protein